MAKSNGWFEVNKEGLAKLLEHRGKSLAVIELVQNAWDTDAKKVSISLEPVHGKPLAKLIVVDDDPDGFHDLTHAFTLFAESDKKTDPEKRGRFNLGEKLVLALCNWAEVRSTTGAYRFTPKEGRVRSRNKTEAGSIFEGELRLRREEYRECIAKLRTLIPPDRIQTTINGEPLVARRPIATFNETLPTEIADEEGNLKPTRRKTIVQVFEPLDGETPSIYELGIPVVETGDKWHVDVAQKVPLNFSRDNVTPGYLRTIRVAVLNALHDQIGEKDAANTWVRDAAADERVTNEAFQTTITKRFGEKVVVADPSDREATHRASSEGYSTISGGHLSGGEWANLHRVGSVKPAGQVFPTSKLRITTDPSAPPLSIVPESKWTDGQRAVVAFTHELAKALLGKDISVSIINEFEQALGACYGDGELFFNQARLGKKWFEEIDNDVVELIIHEFGHEFCGDHLSADYHRALCKLGVKLTSLASSCPTLFNPVTWKE